MSRWSHAAAERRLSLTTGELSAVTQPFPPLSMSCWGSRPFPLLKNLLPHYLPPMPPTGQLPPCLPPTFCLLSDEASAGKF